MRFLEAAALYQIFHGSGHKMCIRDRGLHPHIVIHAQEDMLQIGTSKSVLRYFPDAAILHVGAEQNSQHSADLRLPFAAIALDDHHSLALIAGNQTVADVFLQGGNVLRVEKVIQKLQPEDRFRGVGVIGHREAVADDFRFSLHKPPIQKKRPVGKMNPVRLRWKICLLYTSRCV